MMSNVEILKEMDRLYNELQNATSTKERKAHYFLMTSLMENHKFLFKFWEIREHMRLWTKKIIRVVPETVQKVAEKLSPQLRVNWNEIEIPKDGTHTFYLIQLLNRDFELIWSKIGTSDHIKRRMREHLSYYKKYGIEYIKVQRVYECGRIGAEYYESKFRAYYMSKYMEQYQRTDRFIGVQFDLEKTDKLFAEWKEEVGE